MPTIDFIFFDAGGGHRSAANALKAVIEEQNRPWTVRLVNLQEVLDSLDIFRKVTGIRLEDVYNLILAKGWTLGSRQLLPMMHGLIRLYHPAQVRLLTKYWKETKPDLVVSVVPNFNRALRQSLSAALPAVNLVTILTDLADYPPHFWIERQDQYFICGTERAVQQTKLLGHSAAKVFQTSGMILRPNFYKPIEIDRAIERKRHGLSPDLPTGIILFGGQGSKVMIPIVERLNASKLDLQLILMCGRNQDLADRFRKMKLRIPIHVEGFTSEIPYFMKLSDFFIGKPGPGSISEALEMQLPLIVERNAWTLPQERYNADWVREKGVGFVLKNFTEIAEATGELLEPGNFERLRAAAGAIKNRAIFEIPDLLAQLL